MRQDSNRFYFSFLLRPLDPNTPSSIASPRLLYNHTKLPDTFSRFTGRNMLPPVDPSVLQRNPKLDIVYKDLCTRKLNPDGSTRETKKQRIHDEIRRVSTRSYILRFASVGLHLCRPCRIITLNIHFLASPVYILSAYLTSQCILSNYFQNLNERYLIVFSRNFFSICSTVLKTLELMHLRT
jgi:hypothetical protein